MSIFDFTFLHSVKFFFSFKLNTVFSTHYVNLYKTEERVALRKQCLNETTAASVLLKLFISGNERCHTTDAP